MTLPDPHVIDPNNPNPKTVAWGCVTGCALQGTILFMAFTIGQTIGSTKAGSYVLGLIILTHWIAVLPLIRKATREGETRMRHGLILSACLGALISTTCGAFILKY